MTRHSLMSSAAAVMFSTIIFSAPVAAQEAALTGTVMSEQEGLMEGVLVSAKRDGSTITVTVVSDAEGRYSFPRDRLQPGSYQLSVRAIGYELDRIDGDESSSTIEIAADTTTHDLNLVSAANLAAQFANAEWMLSAPGTDEQKGIFRGCVSCHTLERPFTSRYNSDELAQVLLRMTLYPPNAMPTNPQRLSPEEVARRLDAGPSDAHIRNAEYIASINLGGGRTTWPFELQTLPRPSGKATEVIYTTYDLPRSLSMVHDVIVGADGTVWYNDFGAQYFGRLDPETGEVVEYEVPILKPGFAQGFLDISFDSDGVIYLGNMGQAQVVRFDPKTEEIEAIPAPIYEYGDVRVTMVDPEYSHIDGKLWVILAATADGNRVYQVDKETWEWTRVEYPEPTPQAPNPYDVVADRNNNAYAHQNNLNSTHIWWTDGQTLETKWIEIPDGGGGRRGRVDAENRLWFAQYHANRIAMYDPASGTFRQWDLPLAHGYPYDVMFDDDRYAWTASMLDDFVVRLDVEAGEFTSYLLPERHNIRRVDVVKEGDLSVLWVGDNHGPKITKIEPLTP